MCPTSPLNNCPHYILFDCKVWPTFSIISLGITFCLCNYPQRLNLGDHFLPSALSPRFSPTGQTSQSPSISLGIKFWRIMVKPYLAGGESSSGCTVSSPQRSRHSSATHIDPWNGRLLGTEPRCVVSVVNHCGWTKPHGPYPGVVRCVGMWGVHSRAPFSSRD